MSNFQCLGFYSLLALTAMAIGCAESEAPLAEESASPVVLANAVCPIMGGEAQGDVTVEWDGKNVGFCCAPCIEKWEKLSDEEKGSKLAEAAAGKVTNEHDMHDGEEHDPKHSS